MPTNISSRASVEWAKQQLQSCCDSHKSCVPQLSTISQVPRRLLNIHDSGKGHIHLVEAPQHVKNYACLSYCWGTQPFLRTTAHNIQSHFQKISLKNLPEAFVDAICYARKLGILYLWIDSLCIIQDDANDWKRESAQMASIYQNAHIVLSATKLPSPYNTLFEDVGHEYEAHSLEVMTSEGSEEVRFRRSLTHMPSALHSTQSKSSLPTLSRGWIFQERLLATRVLHFGPQELLWECSELSACQCTVEPTRSSANTTAPAMSGISLRGGELQLKSSFNLQCWYSWDVAALCQCWHKLVEQYSQLNLTHESDIFPAFSGVSKQFQAALRCKSLAGLWEKTLLKDLLWHPSSSLGDTEHIYGRPQKWRAPSWSWASVKSSVSFIDTSHGLEVCCTIKHVYCALAGIDPTGEVSDAHIVLKGSLIQTLLSYPLETIESAQSLQRSLPSKLFLLSEVGKRVSNVWADLDTSIAGKDYLPSGTEVYIFPIGRRTVSKALECLVLKSSFKQGTSDTKLYERIGMVELPRAPLDGLDEWIQPSQRTHTIKLV